MSNNILKVNIEEKIKVLDVFIVAKRLVERISQIFIASSNFISTYIYGDWKAIPVRGPDVNNSNLILTKTTL